MFYIVLPSNSSMDLYPDNKTSSFKVNLATHLDLDIDKWEAALAEIQFPISWYNIRKGRNFIRRGIRGVDFLEDFPEKKSETRRVHWSRVEITAGYYASVKEIIEKLNEKEEGKIIPITYSFEKVSQKTSIKKSERIYINWKNSDIAKCLGFNPDSYILKKERYTSPNLASTKSMYKNVYVYSDIIKNQSVGNVKAPLLRIVPVEGSYGEICCVRYEKPHYFPLSRNHIGTIHVDLRDDKGELISFESGSQTVLTLVFRRKSAKFYD